MERNEFLEMDGLYWESETHEWFHDKIATQHAHKNSILWGGGEQKDALKNIFCFVTRDKSNGKYKRVMVDSNINEVIFDTDSLEELGFQIDKMKIALRFA